MADWKRLTQTDGTQIDVNLDNISHITRDEKKSTSTLFFIDTKSSLIALEVKENPDEVHRAKIMG
jgi:hypothetical protein